jgi:hypothetical protein
MEISSSQKRITALKPVIIVLFTFLLVMNAANLLFVVIYSSSNFFSSTVISHLSIYSSRGIFITHSILSISNCALVLYLIIKKTESRFIPPLLAFYFILFIYPILAG